MRLAITLSLLFCLAATASASPTELVYAPPAAPAPPDPVGLVTRLIGLTAGLLLLCAVVLWFARRAVRPRAIKGNAGGRLQHEGSLVLDRHCAVHLLRADGQTIALTTDATGLRSMVVLSDTFDMALAAAGTEPPSQAGSESLASLG